MKILEDEPESGALASRRERLAVLVASGKAKEMTGTDLAQDQVERLSEKDVEENFKRIRLHCFQRLVTRWLIPFFSLVVD